MEGHSAMTDLLYSDVEDALRASVRSLLTDRSPASLVLKRVETPDTYDTELWHALAADLGVAGLLIPESVGGAGAGAREAAVVLEELGRAVAPVPYLGSAVVATTALLHCGDTELLQSLASGTRTAVLALSLVEAPGPSVGAQSLNVTSQVDSGAHLLSGAVTSVADALPADVLLVPTVDGLFAVDAHADGVVMTPVVSLDLTRQLADITFDGAVGRRIATGAAATDAVQAALLAGAALLASEQVGIASWCVDTTVDYFKTRYQFGRLIGSYQALKHRVADMWVDLAQARAVARYAADCLATGSDDTSVAAAVAQAFVGPATVRIAEECLQLHGGIGFTWEHPIHLYLKRAKSDSLAYGTAAIHRAA
ncbi:MAG TPA: acyl-CoA dehydrogenase family protein, partial [Micromonosporaceae bacterium]|nr:acyl-CoA dehydrogenase family protein [Micromonosporaceae bacterium]